MVLSEAALRRWKVATYAITAATAWQLVFYEQYEIPGYKGKHVFTDIQIAYRGWVDRVIWGRQAALPPAAPVANKTQENEKK